MTVAPAPLNLICFRLKSLKDNGALNNDALNEELLRRLNASGQLYLSHTKLNGKFTLRFCVGQIRTELHHVQDAWAAICAEAARLIGSPEAGSRRNQAASTRD